MTRTSLTFSYSGRTFTFAGELDRVLKGRLSCDCMKSALIREYCDPNFPSLKCGNKIVLVALEEVPASLPPRPELPSNPAFR